jgi:cytochrome c biogenesis protein CcmG/thiol:disulfide interchange protein DsbE
MKKRFLIPLGLFLALAAFLALGLQLNPREVPSPFVGRQAPDFSLPKLAADPAADPGRFSPADMKGRVWMLNVWASWCVSCRQEHPLLMELAKSGAVPIVGLDYKDEAHKARRWLVEHGDPYLLSAVDLDGRVGIDYGVYGVPETYVIDKAGIIRHKQIGPLTAEVVQSKILPLVRKLQQ